MKRLPNGGLKSSKSMGGAPAQFSQGLLNAPSEKFRLLASTDTYITLANVSFGYSRPCALVHRSPTFFFMPLCMPLSA